MLQSLANNNHKHVNLRRILISILLFGMMAGRFFTVVSFEVSVATIDLQRITLIVAFLGAVYLLLADRKKGKTKISKGTKFVYLLFGLFWSGVAVTSVANLLSTSHRMDIAKEGFKLAIVLVSIICMLVFINNKSLWKFTIKVYKILAIILLLFAFIEMFFGVLINEGKYYVLPVRDSGLNFHAPRGFFTNQNDLAGVLLILFAIVAFEIISSASKGKRIRSFVLEALILICCAAIDSSIFMLGSFFLIFILLLIAISNKRKLTRNFIDIVIIACMNCTALIWLKVGIRKLLMLLNGFFINLFHISGSVIDMSLEEEADITGDTLLNQLTTGGIGTVKIRAHLFFNGIKISKTRPIIGYGPNGFAREMVRKKTYDLLPTQRIVDPHNLIGEIMVDYGWIVLIVFLILCIAIIVQLARMIAKKSDIRGSSNDKELLLLALVLFFAFIFTTIMSSSFMTSYTAWIPITLVLIACKVNDIGNDKKVY